VSETVKSSWEAGWPDAGNPHVRFDERRLEIDCNRALRQSPTLLSKKVYLTSWFNYDGLAKTPKNDDWATIAGL
jgi:hypothetical protein